MQGKWREAALYAVSAIPGMGEAIKGAKVARATRHMDEMADAGRALTRNGDEIADLGKVIRRADPDFPTVRPRGTGVRISHNRSGRTNVGADDFWSHPERGSLALPGRGSNPDATYLPLDDLGRPQGADAVVRQGSAAYGTKASRRMKPPGFDSGAGHQRGHLLGKALGGSGRDPGNIATLTRTANNSYMRSYEEAIGRAVAQGETVAVSVRLGYQNGAVPASITIFATGDRGFSIFGTFPNVP